MSKTAILDYDITSPHPGHALCVRRGHIPRCCCNFMQQLCMF